jgi:hypothetical protein
VGEQQSQLFLVVSGQTLLVIFLSVIVGDVKRSFMTVDDKVLPTPGTTGRPGFLCSLLGHIYRHDRCTRPGCKTKLIESTYKQKLNIVASILVFPRYATSGELRSSYAIAEQILDALDIKE